MQIKIHSFALLLLVCLLAGAGAGYLFGSRGISEAREYLQAAQDRNRELYGHLRSATLDSAAIARELEVAKEHNRRARERNRELESQLDESDRLLEQLGGELEALRIRFTIIVDLIKEGAEIVDGITVEENP